MHPWRRSIAAAPRRRPRPQGRDGGSRNDAAQRVAEVAEHVATDDEAAADDALARVHPPPARQTRNRRRNAAADGRSLAESRAEQQPPHPCDGIAPRCHRPRELLALYHPTWWRERCGAACARRSATDAPAPVARRSASGAHRARRPRRRRHDVVSRHARAARAPSRALDARARSSRAARGGRDREPARDPRRRAAARAAAGRQRPRCSARAAPRAAASASRGGRRRPPSRWRRPARGARRGERRRPRRDGRRWRSRGARGSLRARAPKAALAPHIRHALLLAQARARDRRRRCTRCSARCVTGEAPPADAALRAVLVGAATAARRARHAALLAVAPRRSRVVGAARRGSLPPARRRRYARGAAEPLDSIRDAMFGEVATPAAAAAARGAAADARGDARVSNRRVELRPPHRRAGARRRTRTPRYDRRRAAQPQSDASIRTRTCSPATAR